MKEIKVSYAEMVNDYPKIGGKMMNDLYNSQGSVELEYVHFYYYWHIFPEDSDENLEAYKHLLKFDERLDYELEKVSVEIYIKYETYIRGEIVDHLPVPKIIEDSLSDMLISTMRYEQIFFNVEEVIESIPNKLVTLDTYYSKFLDKEVPVLDSTLLSPNLNAETMEDMNLQMKGKLNLFFQIYVKHMICSHQIAGK
jgi:hypothetical protein